MQQQPTRPIDIDRIYRTNQRRLVGLAAAVTMDRGVADEIVHDAFAGLTAHAADVRDPLAYLQRSVINLAVRQTRRRRRLVPVRPVAQPVIPEIDETWAVVRGLPPMQRAVVALRFWDDLALEQIADVLDMPLGTVKSTLHRALTRLKEQIR